ncbi:hypothetical protein [Amycolatopsis sp. NPDC051372]|uniref:hypothetical protein n=1 Tax=Amycolatopsis sp. NPDC051372 TaxID=3155669 RepID=UPI0034405F9F
MKEQSALSTEYVEVLINATTPDGTSVDVDSLLVELAIVPVAQGDPLEGDWAAAAHLRSGVVGLLVGPFGGNARVLERGDYEVWHRTPDNPERPVAATGKLRIT